MIEKEEKDKRNLREKISINECGSRVLWQQQRRQCKRDCRSKCNTEQSKEMKAQTY